MCVGRQLILHFPAEDVLITKHIPDAILINWHALLFCIVHRLTLMPVSILHVVVFSF